MPILHAIVLGIVQGLAEFLPISSSGHLVLTRWLLGWDELPDDVEKAFDVAVHIGTLAGVLVYFRTDLVKLVTAGLRQLSPQQRSADGRFAWRLVLSMLPAVVTGVTLEEVLDDERIWLIAVMLIVFGILLGLADRLPARRGEASFGVRDALAMGVGQALALQPGVSRSGATMTVGRVLGLDRESAARIAFLMSIPVIAGAGVYKAIDTSLPDGMLAPFAWGMASAALTGWLAVWGTMRLVRTRSFAPFVVYRVVAGVAVLVILSTSWR